VPVPFSFFQFPVAFIIWVVPAKLFNVNCPVSSPALIEQEGPATTPASGSALNVQKADDAL
jgi:hypothetical protein